MKRIRIWAVVLGVLLAVGASAAKGQGLEAPVITARSAILIDRQTGIVLWQWNPDLPLPPASTTKIVTAMLALESGRLDQSMVVTDEAAKAPPSKIRLRPGWTMRLRDLVYAVLLNSANDASVVIAEGLAGSVYSFARRMNAEARAMGATNTHFVNPNGLPADDHYSTARDLATMFGQALDNPLFAKIVSTKRAVVFPTFGSYKEIMLHNHNRLLGDYPIQVVGKTGWTLAAKKCFVGAGMADGRELLVAVLGSHDLWGDLKRLLRFGFEGGPTPIPEENDDFRLARNLAFSVGGDNDSEQRHSVRRNRLSAGKLNSRKAAKKPQKNIVAKGRSTPSRNPPPKGRTKVATTRSAMRSAAATPGHAVKAAPKKNAQATRGTGRARSSATKTR